ncbi:uncharacterized protein [Dysidea avara]|uniref:uncharacterized protein n=1 Tax=Dysidea avara TaxID=196820 RepID=UPI00331BA268
MLSCVKSVLTKSSLVTRSLSLGRLYKLPQQVISDGSRGIFPNTVFVGQIPYQVTEEELKSKFPGCVSAKFAENYRGPSIESFKSGYVDFATHEEAAETLQQEVTIRGAILNLDMADYYKAEKKLLPIAQASTLTLFVGYRPSDLTEAELLSLFPGSTSARIVCDRRGSPKGFGFVSFHSPEEVQKGLLLDGYEFKGSPLVVKTASDLPPQQSKSTPTKRGSNPPSSTLYLSNLSLRTTEDMLRATFKGCINVRTLTSNRTAKRRRCYAFVEYSSVEEAKTVFDKPESIEVDGRVLVIEFASSSPQHSDVGKRANHPPCPILHVKNLSYNTSESELKAAFEGCLGVMIIKEFGKSLGYGFVYYSTVEEAKKVFDKPENIEVDGRVLVIDFKKPEYDHDTTNPPSPVLFVTRLPFDATGDTLKTAFEGCVDAKVVVDPVTGGSKGYGFVEYASVEEAQAVVESQEKITMDGHTTLYIDYSSRFPKKHISTAEKDSKSAIEKETNPQYPTLFVGNLSPKTTASKLKAAFKGCIGVNVLKKSGISRGFGFVVYASVEEAKAVLDKQEKIEVDGNVLFIRFKSTEQKMEGDFVADSTSNKERIPPTSTLCVRNLPYSATEATLKAVFEGCINATVIEDPFTSISKGYGFVEYASVEEAKEVMERQENITMDGCTLWITNSKNSYDATVNRGTHPPTSTLYVNRLSPDTTVPQLKTAFEGCVDAKIIMKHGKSLGYGFVSYASVEEAKAVFDEQKDIKLDGKVLFIDFSEAKVEDVSIKRRNVLPSISSTKETVWREDSQPSSRLFVSNLYWHTTDDMLKAAFEGCIDAEIIRQGGISKGFGFVEYASLEEAKAVYDKQEKIIVDDRVLRIEYATPKQTKERCPPSSTLYVNNLSTSTTESMLKAAFEGCIEARIIWEPGKAKGYGFVDFASVEEAKAVLDKRETIEVDGKVLSIRFSAKEAEDVSPNTFWREDNPPSSKLFVQKFYHHTTEDTLKAAFEGCVDAVIIRQNGESKGFGFVEYASLEEAKAVYDQQGKIKVDGHVVLINYATPKQTKGVTTHKELLPPSSTLYVKNLSTSTTESMLTAAFEGSIKARIIWEPGQAKGYGFVDFASIEEAKAVLDKQETIEVDGEVLSINYSLYKSKEGPQPTTTTDDFR